MAYLFSTPLPHMAFLQDNLEFSQYNFEGETPYVALQRLGEIHRKSTLLPFQVANVFLTVMIYFWPIITIVLSPVFYAFQNPM